MLKIEQSFIEDVRQMTIHMENVLRDASPVLVAKMSMTFMGLSQVCPLLRDWVTELDKQRRDNIN